MKKGFTLVELLVCIVIITILIIAIVKGIGGCSQLATKHWGGSMTIDLESGKKLVNCTWKENQLWLLTTQRGTNESPVSYQFEERSTLGILQGKVNIAEH